MDGKECAIERSDCDSDVRSICGQVNDTELMPALSTAFSDADASSSDNLETIFDAQRAQRAADAEVMAAAAAATEAAKADTADAADESEAAAAAAAPSQAAGDASQGEGGGKQREGLEQEATPSGVPEAGQERAARLAARAAVRARKSEQESGDGGSGQQPGSQVWHVIYSMWRG